MKARSPPAAGEAEEPEPRSSAVRRSFIFTHTILRVRGGEFVSLLEPPAGLEAAAAACKNVKTWPVLAGPQGETHTLLSSPIILYDYPRISPESQGNYFDATEIDELLALSVMTLTDAEKQEMRELDAHGREILERTESLSEEQLMKMHGVVRYLREPPSGTGPDSYMPTMRSPSRRKKEQRKARFCLATERGVPAIDWRASSKSRLR